MMDLESPLRNPDVGSPELMTKRAWWLVILGFLFPGLAQTLSGSRRLGRVGLVTTMIVWLVAVFCIALAYTASDALVKIFANIWMLWILQIAVITVAVIWVILAVDTLRLTKLVRVKPKSRRALPVVAVMLIALIVGSATYVANVAQASRGALGSIFTVAGPSVKPVDGRYNILLLGGDAGPDRQGLRPDSISLVSVNAETGESIIVGLPRELQNMPFLETSPMYPLHPNGYAVDRCDLDVCYLNSIYTDVSINHPDLYPEAEVSGSESGIEAVKDAVTGATGLQVQFYVMVDMAGFQSLIDALGGVKIDVKERLPIGGDSNGNGVEGFIEPGLQVMNGYTALWYARSRYSTSDYDRMLRQRELQAAILKQFTPTNVATRFGEVAAASSNIVKTDIPSSMMGTFAELALKARKHKPVTVELTPPSVDPFYPDYALIHSMVTDAVAATTPQPDDEPQ